MSLPSRKLRHSSRKKSPLSRLLTLGVILFGSIFVLFIFYELFLAQKNETAPGLRVVESEQSDGVAPESAADSPAVAAVPAVATKSGSAGEQGPQPADQQGDKPAASSAGPAASDSSTGQSEPTKSETIKSATPKSEDQPKPDQSTAAPTPQNPSPAAAPASATPTPATEKPAQAPEKSPVAAKSEKPKPQSIKHVVKKGETLIQLSRNYYGNQSSVNKIAAYNGIAPDRALPVGKVLYIPVSK